MNTPTSCGTTLVAAIKHYKETHATFVQEEFDKWLTHAVQRCGLYWGAIPYNWDFEP